MLGAVEMCNVLAAHTPQPDSTLTELCVNITRMQRAEIAWMYQWLSNRNHSVLAPCDDCVTINEPPLPCEVLFLICEIPVFCGGMLRNHQCGSSVVPVTGLAANLKLLPFDWQSESRLQPTSVPLIFLRRERSVGSRLLYRRRRPSSSP